MSPHSTCLWPFLCSIAYCAYLKLMSKLQTISLFVLRQLAIHCAFFPASLPSSRRLAFYYVIDWTRSPFFQAKRKWTGQEARGDTYAGMQHFFTSAISVSDDKLIWISASFIPSKRVISNSTDQICECIEIIQNGAFYWSFLVWFYRSCR